MTIEPPEIIWPDVELVELIEAEEVENVLEVEEVELFCDVTKSAAPTATTSTMMMTTAIATRDTAPLWYLSPSK
jgi:hypothetical protein